MPTPDELARAFTNAINAQDAAALGRLARTYSMLYERMRGKLDSLLLAVNGLENPTRGQIMRLNQYKALVSALEDEIARFGIYTESEITVNMSAAVELSLKKTEAYLKSMGVRMPRTLNAQAIYNIIGFTSEDSQLYEKLKGFSDESVQYVIDRLVEGMAFGYNPAKTARLFQKAMGVPLTTAMRYSRTAQLYASREANRAMYVANSDVVTGWRWWTSLDGGVCMACAAMHGTEHPVGESMRSHWNCRCTSVPIVKWFDEGMETGEQWFSKLPESQQKQMMGAQTWQAWKDNLFDFSDLSTRRHDDVWGDILARKPLWELLGAEPPYNTN